MRLFASVGYAFVLTVLLSSATGCGQNVILRSAFDDLTHEASRTETAFATYRSTVSLSGLMPTHSIGMLFFESDYLRSAALPPSLLSGISPRCSWIVESVYPAKGTNEDISARVLDIRKRYVAVQSKTTRLVSDRVALAAMSRRLEVENDATVRLALVNAVTAQQTEIKNLRDGLDKDLAKLNDAVSHENIVVIRWNKELSGGLRLQANERQGLAVGGSSTGSGILILNGLRVRTLFFGDDFLRWLHEKKSDFGGTLGGAFVLSNVGIVTYIVEARGVAFVSEEDFLLSAGVSLGLSKEEVARLLGNDLKLQIGAELAASRSLSSLGSATNAKRGTQNFSFLDARNFFDWTEHIQNLRTFGEKSTEGDNNATVDSGADYTTVFAVRTSVNPSAFAILTSQTLDDDKQKCANQEAKPLRIDQ